MSKNRQNFIEKYPLNSEAASYLIVGGSRKDREKFSFSISTEILKINEKNLSTCPDFIQFKEKSYGINMIKEIIKKLGLKPYLASKKVVLILEAQGLTTQAQNAFLKTLEEPNQSSVIILTAETPKQLLRTIVSRCRVIRLKSNPNLLTLNRVDFRDDLIAFQKFISAGLLTRINFIDQNADLLKEKPTIDRWIDICRNLLINECQSLDQSKPIIFSQKERELIKTIRFLQRGRIMIQDNVNPKLVFEHLALSLPQFEFKELN